MRNQNSYHYLNQYVQTFISSFSSLTTSSNLQLTSRNLDRDGSVYCPNPDGSKYYANRSGLQRYTWPDKEVWERTRADKRWRMVKPAPGSALPSPPSSPVKADQVKYERIHGVVVKTEVKAEADAVVKAESVEDVRTIGSLARATPGVSTTNEIVVKVESAEDMRPDLSAPEIAGAPAGEDADYEDYEEYEDYSDEEEEDKEEEEYVQIKIEQQSERPETSRRHKEEEDDVVVIKREDADD